jgi:hypothetical protein
MRGSNLQAPAGKHVFEFRLTPDSRNAALTQIIPGKNNDSKEKVITVGAWIWADSPLTVQTPVLLVDYRGREIFNQVEVTEEPRFYTFTDTVEASERLVNLSISPAPKQGDDTIMVYYDGILVVEGDWPDNSIPIFDDPNGNSGLWGDREFTNLIRNASAEQSGFNFRSWVDTYIGTRIPGSPSTYLGTFLDPEPLIPHYRASLIFLLQTFWARFGWARVLLVEYRTYRILGYITLTGLIGAALAFWRNRRAIQWDIMLFLGLALVTTWGATILRGLPSLLHGGSFMGPARYAYPVIIPTMLVLDIGWLELMNQIEQKFRIPQRFQLLALIIFFVLLNILSIYSIYVHYYG